jgi:hypothetical protein
MKIRKRIVFFSLIITIFIGLIGYCVWYAVLRPKPRVLTEEQLMNEEIKNAMKSQKPEWLITNDSIEIKFDASGRDTLMPYYLVKEGKFCKSHIYDTIYFFHTNQLITTPKVAFFDTDTFRAHSYLGEDSFKCDVKFGNCFFGAKSAKDYDEDDKEFQFSGIYFQKGFEFWANDVNCEIRFDNCFFGNIFYFNAANDFHNNKLGFLSCFFKAGIDLSNLFYRDKDVYSIMHSLSDSIRSLKFDRDTIFGKISFSNSVFTPSRERKVVFFQTQLDTLDLSYSQLCDTISLRHENIEPVQKNRWWVSHLFFSFFLSPFFDSITNNKIKIDLSGVDLSKIDVDYSLIELIFSEKATTNEKNIVFQTLLDKYKKNGEAENYKLADIDYQDFQGGIFNFFSKYWWYYGYKKWLIFIWSLCLVFVFSFINYRFLPKVYYTYPISSIVNFHHWLIRSDQKGYRKNNRYSKYLACLIYTSILFFGIKIDFEKLKFFKTSISVLIIIQFLIGLICTGFIIHLILK